METIVNRTGSDQFALPRLRLFPCSGGSCIQGTGREGEIWQ